MQIFNLNVCTSSDFCFFEFTNFPFRFRHMCIGLSIWLSNLSAWKKKCCIIASNIRSIHLRFRPLVAALLVEGAFCNQHFGNLLRARSDDPEAFVAGRRCGCSVQSGRLGLRDLRILVQNAVEWISISHAGYVRRLGGRQFR